MQILKHFLQAKWRWKTLRDKQALEQYQVQKIANMVDYAEKHSSFYKQHWKDADLKDWRHLPLTSKTLMMQYFDTFNTVGLWKEDAINIALQAEQQRTFDSKLHGYTVGLSSGTSGQRGLFVLNQTEQDMWTGVVLARVLHSLKSQRIALFLRANSKLYENVKQGRWLQFRYFDLMQDIADTVSELNQYHPTILLAPPSQLEQLAQQKESGKLKINLQRLISVAEILEPQDKQRLEKVFNIPLHQIYQATEGLLAISCQQGSLHIQEDVIKMDFEMLEGDYVTPIITDLWRKTQPIIRYRLGDLLRLESNPCACGHPWRVIKQIEGRESDLLTFGTKNIFPHHLRDLIISVSGIKDYLVIQEQRGDLKIYLEVERSFDDIAQELRFKVLNLLNVGGIYLERLEIIQGLPVREANIKRRRVIRKQ